MKRVRTTNRGVTSGGGTVIVGNGTATWAKFGGREDGLLAKSSVSLDSVAHFPLLTFTPTATHSYAITNDYAVNASASINNISQDVQADVNATASINQIALFPDPFGASEDTYFDQSLGTSSFGGATGLLTKATVPLSNNAQIAYVAFDLTALATGVFTSLSIFLTQVTSALIAENVNVQVYTNATKPFEEDTATWDNDEQPAGTLRQTITASVPTGAAAEIEYVLDATSRTNAVGNWLYLRIVSTGALGLNTITTNSKEAVTGNPRLELEQTT